MKGISSKIRKKSVANFYLYKRKNLPKNQEV